MAFQPLSYSSVACGLFVTTMNILYKWNRTEHQLVDFHTSNEDLVQKPEALQQTISVYFSFNYQTLQSFKVV